MSKLPTPRAVLFDLDDTILSYRPREALLLEVAQEFAAELSPLSPHKIAVAVEREFKEFWADPQNNKAWRTRLYYSILRGSWARRVRAQHGAGPMRPETRARLLKGYRQPTRELEELLDRSLPY